MDEAKQLSPSPHWKRTWQIIAGNVQKITDSEVKRTLFRNKNYIFDGLIQYRESKSEEPPEEKCDKCPKCKKHRYRKFLTRLSHYIKLKSKTAWYILSNFILYEYCGSQSSIEQLKFEMHIVPMLNNIWKFYSAERMYKLKIIKTLLEYENSEDHPYSKIYKAFLITVDYNELWKSLIKQYKYLLKEITNEKLNGELPCRLWFERNLREQSELLQCLVLLAKPAKITLKDWSNVFDMFNKNGFGRSPFCRQAQVLVDTPLFERLVSSEMAVLLSMAKVLWENPESWEQDEEREILDLEISELQPMFNEHAIVQYMWIMMNLIHENPQEHIPKYVKLLEEIEKYKIFTLFLQCLIQPQFDEESSLIGIRMKDCIFDIIQITILRFDNEQCTIIHSPGMVELVAELLKSKKILLQVFENPNGVSRLWFSARETFPARFTYLTLFAHAICCTGPIHAAEMVDELNCIEKYVREFNMRDPKTFLTPSYVVQTESSYFAKAISFQGMQLHVPCDVEIYPSCGTFFVSFNRSFSFWDEYLTQLNHALDADDTNDMLDTYNTNIQLGLQLVAEIIKQLDEPLESCGGLLKVLQQCMIICMKYQSYNHPPMKCLSLCIDIFTACLKQYRNQLLRKLMSANICPIAKEIKHENDILFQHNFIEPGLIGKYLLKAHQPGGEVFVISYLNFIRTAIQLERKENYDLYHLELPGVYLILKQIFPNFSVWYSSNEKVVKEILYHCVFIFQEIFNFTEIDLLTEPYKSMHYFTVHNLLNENCARVLLRMLVIGSEHLQPMMENQNNWHSGEAIQFITSIQIILSILMQLIDLRKKVPNIDITDVQGQYEVKNTPFPFEYLIFSEEPNFKVVKATANLMHMPFHKLIPNLACRLLVKLTYELKTSLLATLELEPEQVRLTFLHKLRDPLESEDLKIAILKLVWICLPYQPGMTEAFFKTTEYKVDEDGGQSPSPKPSTPKKNSNHESIAEFLVEYLMKASADPQYRNSEIFKQVYLIFHTLWMYHREMLIKELIDDKSFWSLLTFPLFIDICYDKKIYSQIFEILTKEVYTVQGYLDENLLPILTTFIKTEKYYNVWIRYMCDTDYLKEICPDDEGNVQLEYPCTLIAWKNLIIVLSNFMPKHYIPHEFKEKLIVSIRQALETQIMYMSDMRSLTYCAEIYLFMMTKWEIPIVKEEQSVIAMYILERISKVITIPKRTKETCLAVALKCMKLVLRRYHTVIETNSPLYERDYKNLIYSLEAILIIEYKDIEMNFKNNTLHVINSKTHRSYLICISLIHVIILAKESEALPECVRIFSYSKIFDYLFTCAAYFASNQNTIDMGIETLEILIAYSKLPIVKNFLIFDLALDLWKMFSPPAGINQDQSLNTDKPIPENLKKWWMLYRRLMILFTVIVKKHRHVVIKQILMFVGLHQKYITQVLLLTTCCMDILGLDLMIDTLTLLYEICKYDDYVRIWKMDDHESFVNIVANLKNCLQFSLTLLLRPNIIKYFTMTKREEIVMIQDTVPLEYLIKMLDKITNIINFSALCMIALSPPLLQLAHERSPYQLDHPILINPSFSIPQLGYSELSYGSILSIAGLLVRIIQQIKRERKTKEVTVLYENLEIKSVPSPDLLIRVGGLSSQTPEDKNKKAEALKLYSDDEIGFVRLDFFNPHCNLQSVQTFSFSHMNYPWSTKLNEDNVEKALETILTLLAQQVGSFLLHFVETEIGKFYIRRELCSELQIFHDHVKKCLVEYYKFDGQENHLFLRRKLEKKMETVVRKINKDIKRIPAESEDDTSYGSYGTNGSSIGSIDTDAILKHNEAEIAKARGKPRSEKKDKTKSEKEGESKADEKESITDALTPVGKTAQTRIVREIFKSKHDFDSTSDIQPTETKELESVKSDTFIDLSRSKTEVLPRKVQSEPFPTPTRRILPPLRQMPQESLLYMQKELRQSSSDDSNQLSCKQVSSLSSTDPDTMSTQSASESASSRLLKSSDEYDSSLTLVGKDLSKQKSSVMSADGSSVRESLSKVSSTVSVESISQNYRDSPVPKKTSSEELSEEFQTTLGLKQKDSINLLRSTPMSVTPINKSDSSKSIPAKLSDGSSAKKLDIVKKDSSETYREDDDDSDEDVTSLRLKYKDSLHCEKFRTLKHKRHANLSEVKEKITEQGSADVLYYNPKGKRKVSTDNVVKTLFTSKQPAKESNSLEVLYFKPTQIVSSEDILGTKERTESGHSIKYLSPNVDDDIIEQIELECPDSPLNWVYSDPFISADDDPNFFDKALQEKMENELPDSESEEELSDSSTITLETSPPSRTISDTSILSIQNSVPIDYIHFLSLWFDFALKTHSA